MNILENMIHQTHIIYTFIEIIIFVESFFNF